LGGGAAAAAAGGGLKYSTTSFHHFTEIIKIKKIINKNIKKIKKIILTITQESIPKHFQEGPYDILAGNYN
jgi:hypothetical protein